METLAMGAYEITDGPAVDEMTLTPTSEGGLDYTDVPYDEQVSNSLKDRIGRTKVYLLEDEAVWGRKRKRDRDDEDEPTNDDEDVSTSDMRRNALLLTGPPIGTLSTSLLFGYAAQWGVQPMGIEWVNDETCVYVFEREEQALKAWNALEAGPGDDGVMSIAHPLPPSLVPPEERITRTLGVGRSEHDGGHIHMRWARIDDVKKRGAGWDSEFYRRKKRRGADGQEVSRGKTTTREARVDELDRELEAFKRGDSVSSPPSDDRRRRGGRRGKRSSGRDRRGGGDEKKTQQQLDDELEAFLREGEP